MGTIKSRWWVRQGLHWWPALFMAGVQAEHLVFRLWREAGHVGLVMAFVCVGLIIAVRVFFIGVQEGCDGE